MARDQDAIGVAPAAPGDLTGLLRAWSAGDEGALGELMERIYRELKGMAANQMRSERTDHTLQPTALVHEAFLRLVDQERSDWQSRAQFFELAARTMRRVLVDHARRKARLKRGGGAVRVDLDRVGATETVAAGAGSLEEVLALHEALERLEALDRRQARVVELHLFAGLSVADTAAVVGCSEATVSRDWRLARLWLARELGRGGADGA